MRKMFTISLLMYSPYKVTQEGTTYRIPTHVRVVNKVFLPRAERISIASIVDLVLLEALDNYTPINLLGSLIEHMKKMEEFKDGNHGLPWVPAHKSL